MAEPIYIRLGMDIMAIKNTVYEYCKNCGGKNASLRDDYVYTGSHRCPDANKDPLYPRNPPKRFYKDNVDFERNVQDKAIEGNDDGQ